MLFLAFFALAACGQTATTAFAEPAHSGALTGATSISNGGFESGLTSWTSTGSTTTSTTAHSGTASGQAGSTSYTSTSSLAQDFTVPSGGATLSFWYKGFCNDTVTYAWATATLTDSTANTTTTLLAKTCTLNGSWVQVTSGALTAGHAMTLTLTNKSESYSNVYNYTLFDDVVLTSSTPSNDFSISASPASATVAAGSSTTVTINSAVTSGSAQTITLAASGLPAGVTASFNPSSVTAGSSSTLTLTAASSAAAASATVTVTGTATSGSHTTSVALTVTATTSGGGLTNGGFETGTFSGWTTSGTASIVTTSHTGGYAAQLGSTGPTNGDSTAAQTFTAPTGATSLSFWYKVTCPDTVTYDWATVSLKDNTAGTTSTPLAKTCVTAGAWTQVSVSITAGHSYTLTLTNHDDNYTGDATYTQYDDVVIATSTPANDFSLSVSPASQTVAPGSSVAYTVSTTATGTAQTVSLAVSGLPSGVTGSFSPSSVTAGSSSTLTLAAASTAAAATATFTVTGTAASGSHTATASVTVSSSGGTGVGNTGGTVDHLFFAVVGDTRPGTLDDTTNYPTAIVTKIYQDIQAMSPRPQFVLTTGDYMFAGTTSGTAQPQMNLYVGARNNYSGSVFAAMGNHECDGYTADNCTSLSQSQNITAFMSGLVTPLGQSLPYYSIPVNAIDGSWSAKFINVACNYWSSTQQTWLQQQLATATTYTILFRHEPAAATTGPCVNAVEQLMTQYPYNLSLVGHTHTFSLSGKEAIVGNGGAPQTAVPYGYATVERLSTGWQIKQYDYSSGLPVNTYTVP